ncbi:hypothetical protein CL634_09945 [bacterium]|nr:hypothetical protein [bacterium]|tara:strand:- start:220 stop:423 length:204 start_codon:yes stop_codon:yes gene_type:complete
MKVGDMVTIKKSVVKNFSSWWFSICAENQTPLLITGTHQLVDRFELLHPDFGTVFIDKENLTIRATL